MSTRDIARTATVSRCPTAVHATVEGLDLEELVADKALRELAGIPASSRQRGARFEKLLAKDDHRLLRDALAGPLGRTTPISRGQVSDMRGGFRPGVEGLPDRAAASVTPLQKMAAGACDAPVVLAGPVLTYRLGTNLRYAEADFVARHVNGQLVVVEAKAHPMVEGLIVGGAQTDWRLQVSVYANALADLLALWGHGHAVSDTALLVLPEGYRLTPITVRSLHIAGDRVSAAVTLERLGAGR